MKNIIILIFGLFLNQLIFSQTDKNGNPIFNNQLISEEKLENIEEYIRKETINGELDFSKVANENKAPFLLYDQVMYNKKDFAILLWGKKVQTLGIEKSKKAIKLWEEINGRELTKPEKKALLKGFEIKE